MTDSQDNAKEEKPKRFRSLKDWESSVDKTLREAIERGEFDNLRGKGKPLAFNDNPFTPAEWQLAFKMLQDAGYAPDWIEFDKDIRKLSAELQTMLDRHARWEHAERARIEKFPPEKQKGEREYISLIRERTLAQYRERAGELNKLIDVFNLKAPSPQVHHARLRIDEIIAEFKNKLGQ